MKGTPPLRAVVFGWAGSLAVHLAVVALMLYSPTGPDVGFDFELPDEVEFGLTEAAEVTPEPAEPTESAPTAEVAEPTTEEGETEAPATEASDAEEVTDEEADERGVAFLPAGAQIALRIDISRIRRSPLGRDVRGLMSDLPDWRAVLDGSGIDPLEDLDRVLVATPNFDRARIVVAGRVMSDEAAIRVAAESIASTHGDAPLSWRRRQGFPSAPWHGPDGHDRRVTIVGPRHFVLCRPADLRRVLAIAGARRRGEERGADALLSMGEGVGLSLEVEGARTFARARPNRAAPIERIPTRLQLELSESEESPERVHIRIRADYDDEDDARAGREFWERMRAENQNNLGLRLFGVAPLLSRASLVAEGSAVEITSQLTHAEISRLLSLLGSYLRDRARSRQSPGRAAPEATDEAEPPGQEDQPE